MRKILLPVAVAIALIGTIAARNAALGQQFPDNNGVYQVLVRTTYPPEAAAVIRQQREQNRQQQPPADPRTPNPQPPVTQPPSTQQQPPTPPSPTTPEQANPPTQPVFSSSSGTGFLVRGKRLVATNNHVVKHQLKAQNGQTIDAVAEEYFIAFVRGNEPEVVKAKLVANDPDRDLALLEADGDLPGTPFTIADYDAKLQLDVEVHGFPGISQIMAAAGSKRLVTFDEMRNLRRELAASQLVPVQTQGRVQRLIQQEISKAGQRRVILHTASAGPGNSGGPLLNQCRQVVGVHTFGRSNTERDVRAFFAVSARELADLMREKGLEPSLATSFCLLPGSATDYLPYGIAVASMLFAAMTLFLNRRRPMVQKSVSAISRGMSRIVTRPPPVPLPPSLRPAPAPVPVAAAPSLTPQQAPARTSAAPAATIPPSPVPPQKPDDMKAAAKVAEPAKSAPARTEVKALPEKPKRAPPSWRLKGADTTGRALEIVLSPPADAEHEWSVGRMANSNSVVIADRSVSSLHARIRFRPGQGLEIADLGSSNGTYVAGERIALSFVKLEPGAALRLGGVELKVSLEEAT